jgi:hypothetical protein
MNAEAQDKLHRAVARACIDYSRAYDISAADLAAYLEAAAKGMRMNAAFGLKGDALAAALQADLDT